MLNEILTVSGKPSLYKLLTRGRGALIVENIDETKKRFPIQGTDKVVSLGDISIFTDETEMPLRVYREEEALYRRAGDLVVSTVRKYTARAQGKKSAIDILNLALVDIALKYEMEVERNDTKPFTDIITKLTSEIENALGGKTA